MAQTAGELQAPGRSHSPPPCAPPLLGWPELPFAVRHNLTCARTDALLDYISLVFNVLGLIRFWPYLFPWANAWFALHFALPLANMAWRRRCMAACPADGGSWGRWREVLCAVLRATACMSCTWQLILTAMDAERGAAGGARHDRIATLAAAGLDFVNISAALVIVLLSFKPLRVGYALPLQLLLTLAAYARYAGSVCSHPAIPPPHLRPLLHAIARGLDAAVLVLPPFLSRLDTRAQGSVAECTSLLVFLQLCACLLPALYKAHEELRLFELHQWQRAQRGLPLERGWDARVYGAAGELLPPMGRASLLWAALLVAILWHAAATLQSIGLV